MLFAADSESGSVAPDRTDWTRGIRIGSVRDGKDGKVQFFIPDPGPERHEHQRGRGHRGGRRPATFMAPKSARGR